MSSLVTRRSDCAVVAEVRNVVVPDADGREDRTGRGRVLTTVVRGGRRRRIICAEKVSQMLHKDQIYKMREYNHWCVCELCIGAGFKAVISVPPHHDNWGRL